MPKNAFSAHGIRLHGYNVTMRWALGTLLLCSVAAGQTRPDFVRDIQPVFKKRCQACHGAAQQMNGLRLDDGASARKGGYSGPVIVPGNSGASKLIQRVTAEKPPLRMPPAGPPLSAPEVALLRAWIDQGAAISQSDATAAPGKPASSHWAFQPVRRPTPPAVRQRDWLRNPIDAFVLARLEREGTAPSPEAPKYTLIRRASLDLTGLPPTPDEVRAFLADNRPDAWERLIDSLLASPHFGEKWARQWLDLAHYADSDGYEKDRERPWAWRYRQWVIGAVNRDVPFDQFTIEQLAGDALPGATVEQRVATGFLRNTLTNREGGTDRAEARFEQVVNRTNTIGTVWLGLTVGCAQCHNHKYDPISQKEYYQLSAFVHRAEEVDIDAPLPGETGPYLAARPAYLEQVEAVYRDYGIRERMAVWEEKMRTAMANPGRDLEWDFQVANSLPMFDHLRKILATEPARRRPRDQERLTRWFLATPGHEFGRDKELMARFKEAKEKLAAADAAFPNVTQAPAMEDDPALPPAYIAVRGDFRNKGLDVEPAALAVLPPAEPDARSPRLALARWLTNPANPLPARVAVNRIWQELFGRGIVRTSEDFGAMGEKPSHPELLDWLASEFVERGWSRKQMIRLIMTSATYRQSSRFRPELNEKDPENMLLARQSRVRLDGEFIRDAALAVSGLLYTEIGGRSVRPPQPAGVAELGYAGSVKWNESAGKDRYRRGLYIHFQRTTAYPMLVTFDHPDTNVACTRRRVSNTPLQALNLLNDPVFHEAAQALAFRLEQEPPGSRLDAAFQLCLGRPPSGRERERLTHYLNSESGRWTAVARVLLNLDEFITRE